MFNFTQLLSRNIQQRAEQTAIRIAGQSWTYGEMGARVAKLASALQGLGMEPGDRVALLSLNSPVHLEYLFGVPWGGGVVNPVNSRWSAEEIAYSLEDSGTRILFSLTPCGAKIRTTTFRPLLDSSS